MSNILHHWNRVAIWISRAKWVLLGQNRRALSNGTILLP